MYVFFIPAVRVLAQITYDNSQKKFEGPNSEDAFKKHLERYVSKID